MNGHHYYSIIKGSNNQWTFLRFLKDLFQKLSLRYRFWKSNSVILLDNARIHDTQPILKFMEKSKVNILFSAPASFNAIPIELLFSSLKRKFGAICSEKLCEASRC